MTSPEVILLMKRFNQAMADSQGLLQDMCDRFRELDSDIQSFTAELSAHNIHES